MKGYLAPFKGPQHRYHLPDFRRSSQPPTGYYEVFNFARASLRNVIEGTFGVWKNRWRILLDMPSYEFSTQCKIVVPPRRFIIISGNMPLKMKSSMK